MKNVQVVLRRDDGKEEVFDSFDVDENTEVDDLSGNWLQLEESILEFGQKE